MQKNNIDIRQNENKIAAFIGISGPETPKYMLTNNFLIDYFTPGGDTSNVYSFKKIEEIRSLHVEDEINRVQLEKSFDAFLKRYSGEEAIKGGNNRLNDSKHYFFPLNQEMLVGSANANLRHILFNLQCLDEEHFDYKDMQQKLAAYIFYDASGINHILKILLQNQDEEIKYRVRLEKERNDQMRNFWSMLNKSEFLRMKSLGQQLNEDLNILLEHEYFCKLDFYRKYNYLSILLTGYVIQYIVRRKDLNACVLCKGNPSDSRLNGMLHKACCSNYVSVRNLFPTLLQQYYSEALEKELDASRKLYLKIEDGNVLINGKKFKDFAEKVMGSKSRSEIEFDRIVDVFRLSKGEEIPITAEDFVLRYIDITRSSSTLTKISSTLPTCGKQIGMIFPESKAKQKYFAMSSTLTEFYVRLYLAQKNQKYDYLDNFVEHLQKRYRIVLVKSKESESLLKKLKLNITAQEFAKNKLAFIDTLNSISCLIKLSDSGYVITLPEEKGDFKLI